MTRLWYDYEAVWSKLYETYVYINSVIGEVLAFVKLVNLLVGLRDMLKCDKFYANHNGVSLWSRFFKSNLKLTDMISCNFRLHATETCQRK